MGALGKCAEKDGGALFALVAVNTLSGRVPGVRWVENEESRFATIAAAAAAAAAISAAAATDSAVLNFDRSPS